MKSWSENQAEETIKNLRSAYISSHKKICVVRISVTRKQSQFILNWGDGSLLQIGQSLNYNQV